MDFSHRSARVFVWLLIYAAIMISFQLDKLGPAYHPSSTLSEAMLGMISIYDLAEFGFGILLLYGIFYGVDFVISLGYKKICQL